MTMDVIMIEMKDKNILQSAGVKFWRTATKSCWVGVEGYWFLIFVETMTVITEEMSAMTMEAAGLMAMSIKDAITMPV